MTDTFNADLAGAVRRVNAEWSKLPPERRPDPDVEAWRRVDAELRRCRVMGDTISAHEAIDNWTAAELRRIEEARRG